MLAVLGLVVISAGCGGARHGPVPASGAAAGATASPGVRGARSGCWRTVTTPDEVAAALDRATAGDAVCFAGTELADMDVIMSRSGSAQAPITLVGGGTRVDSMRVSASNVVVTGFTVTGGDGMLLEGIGLTARNNTVHDTQRGGITCTCTDSLIESNVMRHTASNGLDIIGSRITVHANTISDTVPRDGGDADGVRFYGTDLRLLANTISDITASGYSDPPHPDCFQTLDSGKPPTYDVVIAGNTCRDVDAQCLIASGDPDHFTPAPGMLSILFVGNLCAANGAQAVNLQHWPDVEVLDNDMSGPNLDRGVSITDGSTGVTVTGNTTTRGLPTVDIDDSSRPGFHQDRNSTPSP